MVYRVAQAELEKPEVAQLRLLRGLARPEEFSISD